MMVTPAGLQPDNMLMSVRRRIVGVLSLAVLLTVLCLTASLYLGSVNRTLTELSHLKSTEYILATEIVNTFEFYRSETVGISQRARRRAAERILIKGEEFLQLNRQTRTILDAKSSGVFAWLWPSCLTRSVILTPAEVVSSFIWSFENLKTHFANLDTSNYGSNEETVMMLRQGWRPHYTRAYSLLSGEVVRNQYLLRNLTTTAIIIVVVTIVALYLLSIQPVLRRLSEVAQLREVRARVQEAMVHFIRSVTREIHGSRLTVNGAIKRMNWLVQHEPALEEMTFHSAGEMSAQQAQAQNRLLLTAQYTGIDGAAEVDACIPRSLADHREHFLPFLGALASNLAAATENALRMQAETQRDALQELTSQAFESMPQIIAIYRLDGSCVMTNSAFRQHLKTYSGGNASHETIGVLGSLRAHILEQVAGSGEAIDDLFAAGPPTKMTLRYDDQSLFHWSRSRVHALGYVFLGQNVTSIYDDAATLEHKRRLEMLGQVAGTVAHESNNLLAVVQGAIEIVQINEKISDDSLTLLNRAISASNQAHAMSSRLLSFSRKQDFVPASVTLADTVEEVRIYLRGSAYKAVELELIDDDAVVLFVDPGHFRSALLNLVNNAAHAQNGEGVIVIEACEASHSTARVTIADCGPGFSSDALEKALTPFFTEKAIGTGLGLAAVDSFVTQSQGSMRLYNAQSGGGVVELLLPLAENLLEHAPEIPKARPESPMYGDIRVLLVEDNLQLGDLLETFLNQHDFSVIRAKDIETAQRVLNNAALEFDLIVSDVQLPDGNSLSFLKKCRQLKPGIITIIMTGYSTEDIDHYARMPNTHIMRKPFQLSVFWALIEKVLDENESPANPAAAQPVFRDQVDRD